MSEAAKQHLLQHYRQPHHAGKLGKYTHSAKLENLSCGDGVEVFLLVEDDRVVDVSHVSEGCSIAIAAASMLSDYLIGKQLSEIEILDKDFMLKLVQIELGPARVGCATLISEAVQKALEPSPLVSPN